MTTSGPRRAEVSTGEWAWHVARASITEDERDHDISPLDVLAALDELRAEVETEIRNQVTLVRAQGAQWADVGHVLGVSKQAAHKRYGPPTRRTNDSGDVDPLQEQIDL